MKATLADLGAGLSIAGLLLPEAVAYAGIAGVPPQAGVLSLLVGLAVYGFFGSSRFAIVSATSSSAAVLFAATSAIDGASPALRMAAGAGIVLFAGALFVAAGVARLGELSSFIAKPVLRGFALGLALSIVIKQLPHVLELKAQHGETLRLAWELLMRWHEWNLAGAAMALVALAVLHAAARWRMLPAALLVIVGGIVLDLMGFGAQWGLSAVGPIELGLPRPAVPDLGADQWLRLGEVAFALALVLYAESYGSIRSFALRHGDTVDTNRDLVVLGAANLVSGLLRGMPVGAGYSATSANEAAGATSRLAGLIAGAVVLIAAVALLPLVAHTPMPLLAAIVIHAVGHTLNPRVLRNCFDWHRDRLVAVFAIAAVLLLGVLDGLLASIALSVLMLVQRFTRTRVVWLGRLGDSHDYVDAARHADARVPEGQLIARPEGPLFFGNADAVFSTIRHELARHPEIKRVVLSLEESPDLDATSTEALVDFAMQLRMAGATLVLARVKDRLRDLLDRVASPELPAPSYAAWSVDDAVKT